MAGPAVLLLSVAAAPAVMAAADGDSDGVERPAIVEVERRAGADASLRRIADAHGRTGGRDPTWWAEPLILSLPEHNMAHGGSF